MEGEKAEEKQEADEDEEVAAIVAVGMAPPASGGEEERKSVCLALASMLDLAVMGRSGSAGEGVSVSIALSCDLCGDDAEWEVMLT
mmetsp:Transcript_104108/g.222426  ORF Transcript_104108/g.222426 Transcript_104108/m.222426 type:complete len:86 (+) Transcript_104108:2-259(+)